MLSVPGFYVRWQKWPLNSGNISVSHFSFIRDINITLKSPSPFLPKYDTETLQQFSRNVQVFLVGNINVRAYVTFMFSEKVIPVSQCPFRGSTSHPVKNGVSPNCRKNRGVSFCNGHGKTAPWRQP